MVTNYKKVKHELKEAEKEYAYEQQVQSRLNNLIDKSTKSLEIKNEKVAELKALNKEKEKLKKKIKKLEKIHTVQKVMFGTQKDVEEIVKQKLPADTLATITAVLKR